MTAPGTGNHPGRVGQIAIDVGGTFTDLVLAWSGDVTVYKEPSDPDVPSRAVIAGLRYLADQRGLSLPDFLHQVRMIRHGTTITTNALLTGKCPPVGLVTTKGFRDTLALRQGLRENVHDPRSVPPPPLVPRHLCLGVTERVDYNGNVLIPLDEAEVETVARQLRAAGVQSVAVCFLHSYTNPDHEQRARQLISAVMPDASVVISREVLPRSNSTSASAPRYLPPCLLPSWTVTWSNYRRNCKGWASQEPSCLCKQTAE